MDMLHLVPVMLLGFVGCWLLWPVFVEPTLRRLRLGPRFASQSADLIADDLFEAWSTRGARPRLVELDRKA